MKFSIDKNTNKDKHSDRPTTKKTIIQFDKSLIRFPNCHDRFILKLMQLIPWFSRDDIQSSTIIYIEVTEMTTYFYFL